MTVSMYGTTCAQCAKRTLAPGYLDRTHRNLVGWDMRCSVPNRGPQRARCRWNERQPSAIPNIGSVSPNQLVVVQLLRVQRPPPPWTVPMRTRCCCHGSWSVSSLSCAARFIFFMEGTGMTEASKQRGLLLNGVSATPRARVALVGDGRFAEATCGPKSYHADGVRDNTVFSEWF